MANSFGTWIAGGVKRAQLGFKDADGLMCGSVTALAAGEDSPMMDFPAVKSIDITMPEYPTESQTGDDQVQGTIRFSPTENITLGITRGTQVQSLEAALDGTLVYDDDGMADVKTIHPIIQTFPRACFLVHATAKSKVYGSRPASGWEIHLFNDGDFGIGGADAINERTMRNYDYTMECEQTYEWAFGKTFSGSDEGTVGGAGGYWTADSWVTMHAYRGAGGSDLTFDLLYTPLGLHTTDYIKVAKYTATTGVWSAVAPTTGFTVSGKTVTLVGTTLINDHYIVRYNHSPLLT